MTLDIEPNIARGDDFYEMLIDAHRDLTPAESERVNCKRVRLLATHGGDPDGLADPRARARAGVGDPKEPP